MKVPRLIDGDSYSSGFLVNLFDVLALKLYTSVIGHGHQIVIAYPKAASQYQRPYGIWQQKSAVSSCHY
jgi:hypothetical protein